MTIAENTLYTGATPSLSGDDPIGTVTYTLEGADQNLFSINAATGVVTMEAKDFENPEDADENSVYQIEITATDSDNNTATTNWSVEVKDVVGFSIIPISNATIDENTSYIGPVAELTVNDNVGAVTYTLGGADKDLFSINQATGVVTMQAKDFENPEDANNNNDYEIGITATDSEGNRATETWTVTVTNVIDFSIIPISDVTIAENTVYTGVIPTVLRIFRSYFLEEPWRGAVTYSKSGADQNLFSLNQATGVVTMQLRILRIQKMLIITTLTR